MLDRIRAGPRTTRVTGPSAATGSRPDDGRPMQRRRARPAPRRLLAGGERAARVRRMFPPPGRRRTAPLHRALHRSDRSPGPGSDRCTPATERRRATPPASGRIPLRHSDLTGIPPRAPAIPRYSVQPNPRSRDAHRMTTQRSAGRGRAGESIVSIPDTRNSRACSTAARRGCGGSGSTARQGRPKLVSGAVETGSSRGFAGSGPDPACQRRNACLRLTCRTRLAARTLGRCEPASRADVPDTVRTFVPPGAGLRNALPQAGIREAGRGHCGRRVRSGHAPVRSSPSSRRLLRYRAHVG
jgi:hypothetical protein